LATVDFFNCPAQSLVTVQRKTQNLSLKVPLLQGGYELLLRGVPRLRGKVLGAVLGVDFRNVGVHCRFFGTDRMKMGRNLSVGNYCWFEAVKAFAGQRYEPELSIGNDISTADFVHISCCHQIKIGHGCLIGSKVYIGDHTHGPTKDLLPENMLQHPVRRPLLNIDTVTIGDRCWIGDGALIFGGANISPGSIVGGNSVVRLKTRKASLIAGAPARIVRELE
jgi:acetyltransferase-like isoleucine patch superfamily enzyme